MVALSERTEPVLPLTEAQQQQLKQWIAEPRQWILPDEAVRLIKDYLNTTQGRARKLLLKARKSGEVDFANDDPAGDPRYDYAYKKDDLLGRLNRRYPQTPQAEPLTEQPKSVANLERQVQRTRAKRALKQLWPDGFPDSTVLPDNLCASVMTWIRADCTKRKIPFSEISNKTIMRAARDLWPNLWPK
jgi:hypothetical protein